ncbi:MAG: SRPBCC domain-containing protein [Myxococcaceae bacterium]|nr:SRPBCC domain-containing protein [Myxococcaceae bacterium]MCI0672419.1 SRPBCC domain-containing protein [Myxococcaceae bacterium]
MTDNDVPQAGDVALVVRRTIRAPVGRVFDAWTQPEHLRRWWGPGGPVRCPDAEVDLRVGGRYRIANAFPDGRVVWIVGEFELVSPPHRLVYSWRLEPGTQEPERVTVRFEPKDGATEVIVVHERIASQASRDEHEKGWNGCLDGLAAYLGGEQG